VHATPQDDESVVADECHIISPKANGPRHDSSYPPENLDSYDNLILLCRVHHKQIDDQISTFTIDILRQSKVNHEAWVANKLTEEQKLEPVRLRRLKEEIPIFLMRLTTGKEIIDLAANAMAFGFDHCELKSRDQLELVSNFFQQVQDVGDLISEFEAGYRVEAAFELSELLQELNNAGFMVFGGKEMQLLEGGYSNAPQNWPIAIFKILYQDDRSILKVDFSELDNVLAGDKAKTR
jgi:hypothetical protein